ncbi:glycosyltransferase [Butyrivibrio sp. AC2005]|uniref:glycosyltransferase n=1 Tax=Butyrivibrio sp. AC2005 TaxID=1280672 RepID=UPI00041BC815|nr:glycosyltransferase [Butyrivibrio sp. AC2005]
MKVLIVINNLDSGGAQKSLVSFLKALEEDGGFADYSIDLLLGEKKGIFLQDIPKQVNIIDTPKYFKWMNCEVHELNIIKDFSLYGIIGKVLYIIKKKIGRNSKYGRSEFWLTWRNIIPTNDKQYDIAIAYMDGWPNYYVTEKVNAKKKVLWVHNEYQKLGYYKELDKRCYENSDRMITISEKCRASLIEAFPECIEKITVLENITLASDIMRKANRGCAPEFERNKEKMKLLSVGRLVEQKAFDLAIRTANELRKRNISFIWLILGEGPDRAKLEKLISEYQLENYVFLLGVRENPYAYMNACDIFVQTSIFEGKSIVIDEAKLLSKPIVITNYKTAKDTIKNRINGIIVSMDENSVADGIEEFINNCDFKNKVVDYLKANCHGNESELNKYIDVMF